MGAIRHIFLLVGILAMAWTAYAQNAVDPHPFRGVDDQLSSQTLSASQIETFHKRAESKAEEINAYLGILADKDAPVEFKQTAEEMIKGSFQDEGNSVVMNGKVMTLDEFIKKIMQPGSKNPWNKSGNETKESTRIKTTDLTGQVSLSLQNGTKIMLQYQIQLRDKMFGNQSKSVWEVVFDELKAE